MTGFFLILFLFFFAGFYPTVLLAENKIEKSPVSDQERAKILKQMQGFSERLQKMPELPKMNDTIILPEPKEKEVHQG